MLSIPRGLLLTVLALVAGPTHATIAFEPYPFETQAHGTHDAEVGFFEVPRRHAEPDGPRYKLRVVRLAARRPLAGAAPIVYLAGGPGGSGVGSARGPRWPIFDQMRAQHDVLLFDQRGTGMSDVPPPCPFQPSPTAMDLQGARLDAQAIARRCVEEWRHAGIDLDSYTTRESAADLKALQQAYGVPKIQLWGMSYGTHLSIAVLRDYPEIVARAVLMGVEGPDDTLKLPLSVDRMLQRHAALLAADPALRSQFPDLVGDTRALLADLRAAPRTATRWRPGGTREVLLTEFAAQRAIAMSLGHRSSARRVPLMVQSARQGDDSLLAEFVYAIDLREDQLRAMPLAMDYASGVSAARLQQIEAEATQSLFGHALNFPFPEIGDGLGLRKLDDAFRAPLHSSAPILLVSGDLDLRTPPSNAEALAATLSQAGHLVIANALHDDDLWLSHADIAPILQAFFAGAAPVDRQLQAAPPDYATNLYAELWRELKLPIFKLLAIIVASALVLRYGWRRWRRAISRR
ncbi:MAG: alpha/beta fold hydrolase [Rhodanobacteraceae bacterium]|nr:alpha/beta fold hydrolase [Rhodanobacteraceae bacterium]